MQVCAGQVATWLSQTCKGATVTKFDCTGLHGTMQMVGMKQDTFGVSASLHAQVGCHDALPRQIIARCFAVCISVTFPQDKLELLDGHTCTK